jgi:hypothetical protein
MTFLPSGKKCRPERAHWIYDVGPEVHENCAGDGPNTAEGPGDQPARAAAAPRGTAPLRSGCARRAGGVRMWPPHRGDMCGAAIV